MEADLVDFLNGLPSLACALVSTAQDLEDGRAVVEAAVHVLGCDAADAHAALDALSGVAADRLDRRESAAQLLALEALRSKQRTPARPQTTVGYHPNATDRALCDVCRKLCGAALSEDVAEALRPPDPRALCDAAARRHRSLVVVELAARVLRRDGAAKACVRPLPHGRWELAGTDRTGFSSGAAVANVRRALAALRASQALDPKIRLRAAVPASAVAAGDAEALRRVLRVALDALAVPRNRRPLAVDGESSDAPSDAEAPRPACPTPPARRPTPASPRSSRSSPGRAAVSKHPVARIPPVPARPPRRNAPDEPAPPPRPVRPTVKPPPAPRSTPPLAAPPPPPEPRPPLARARTPRRGELRSTSDFVPVQDDDTRALAATGNVGELKAFLRRRDMEARRGRAPSPAPTEPARRAARRGTRPSPAGRRRPQRAASKGPVPPKRAPREPPPLPELPEAVLATARHHRARREASKRAKAWVDPATTREKPRRPAPPRPGRRPPQRAPKPCSDCESESSDDGAYYLPPATRRDELAARAWLAGLGFRSAAARPSLSNPLTNGALLADVALALVDPSLIPPRDRAIVDRAASGRRPASRKSARARVRCVLRCLRHLAVPRSYLGRAAPFVGSPSAAWPLLAALARVEQRPPKLDAASKRGPGDAEVDRLAAAVRDASDDEAEHLAHDLLAASRARDALSTKERTAQGARVRTVAAGLHETAPAPAEPIEPAPTPPRRLAEPAPPSPFPRPWRLAYAPADRAQVRRSLDRWLAELGVCERAPALHVDVLKRDFSDGVLLCALAERVTGVKLSPLPPKTRGLRLANLRKALSVLRDWNVKLGWRHPAPATEAGCEAGDWGVLLPLLEDCYRCAHDWAPRAAVGESPAGAMDVAADGEAVDVQGDAVRPCVGPTRTRTPPRRLAGSEDEVPPVLARRWSGTAFVRRSPRPMPRD